MDGQLQAFLKKSTLELGAAQNAPATGHWRYAVDADAVGWLVLDCEGARVNTISAPVLRELEGHLAQIERDKPNALVLRSAKLAGFAAGADINSLADMDADAATQLLGEAHALLDRLEGLACPTIAVVHGAALGAGFELALACDYRIAIEGASFGLPEAKLGLHPGLGGTYRLPELIDPTEAMTMMLAGKTAHTKRAKKLGIADLVVEERHVQGAVAAIVRGEVSRPARGWMARAFSLTKARSIAADRMRRETEKKAPRQHYPAPYALIENWERHGNDRRAMAKAEIDSFAALLQSDTSKNLIRAFFLRQTLRSGAGEQRDDITHVHVIGAGIMGAEIAAWAAMQGKAVSVTDPDIKALGKMVRQAGEICRDAHKDSLATRDTLDRLMPDPDGLGQRRADLVIEAGPEKPEIKERIFADLAKQMKPGAILATNTSSLELSKLVESAPDGTRFAGLHFFNPVSKIPLVEVVSHAATSDETRARLMAFCTGIDRLPVAVRDAPGFLVNRTLMPYLLEALILLDEGVSKEQIDRDALDFGMPMGPVTLADQVGLDICLDVAQSLSRSLDGMPEIPALLREKVEAGDLGRKTGRGFYNWSEGAPRPGEGLRADPERTDRLILPMLNACAACLRSGVVASRDELDAAMIFATGFAPFRGGPMEYARARGHEAVAERLSALEKAHGPRFAPDPWWQDHA